MAKTKAKEVEVEPVESVPPLRVSIRELLAMALPGLAHYYVQVVDSDNDRSPFAVYASQAFEALEYLSDLITERGHDGIKEFK